jgi:cysteine desulfurase
LPDVYLDNSATTRPYPEVIGLMSRVQAETYGNPSSMHEKGLAAEKLIGEARRQIATVIGAREHEIIFTSGGTEANNLAIKGTAYRNRRRGSHLITTTIEHPSVLNCFRSLEHEGFEVSYLPVNKRGLLNPNEVKALIRKDTILISIMHVNNEIGSIQPLDQIGRTIKETNPDLLFHIDAVQSFTRLPLILKEWQADLVSCSAHKLHGPKGAGCLWVREGVQLQPLFDGGGQEKGLRSGTENVAAIAGFGLAALLSGESRKQKMAAVSGLKKTFYKAIQESGVNCLLNGPSPEEGAPHIINLSFPGLKAEMLLHSLEEQGIYVSAGSACHSRHPEPSHVLMAIGLRGKPLEGALRFSFSFLNSEEEVLSAAAETANTVRRLSLLIN